MLAYRFLVIQTFAARCAFEFEIVHVTFRCDLRCRGNRFGRPNENPAALLLPKSLGPIEIFPCCFRGLYLNRLINRI